MPRTPLIAGNWKMNNTVDKSVALALAVAEGVREMLAAEVSVHPPFVALQAVAEELSDSRVSVGAQDMYHEEAGAFTGEISPLMLAGLCSSVILGHSERRHIFGEQDDSIALKVRSAFDHGLTPVLCVGELLTERESGQTETVLSRQLGTVSDRITPDEAANMVVAYEPVWAIGTGVNATPAQAGDGCGFVRNFVAEQFGAESAARLRILYGGSVNHRNWREIALQENVDGALVGGASLNAADFLRLVDISCEISGS